MENRYVKPRVSDPMLLALSSNLVHWSDWLKWWNMENLPLQIRLGLLHVGFDMRTAVLERAEVDEEADRLCLYIDCITLSYYQPEGSGLRQGSEKAIAILCDKFFKLEVDNFLNGATNNLFAKKRVFEKLLEFIKDKAHRIILGQTRCAGHHRDTIVKFTEWFASIPFMYTYQFQGTHGRNPSEHLKSKVIPIIVDVLEKPNCLLALNLDFPSLLVLKDLAMREMNFPDGLREPSTLEEAAAFGSGTARVLLLLLNAGREKRKLKRIMEAKTASKLA